MKSIILTYDRYLAGYTDKTHRLSLCYSGLRALNPKLPRASLYTPRPHKIRLVFGKGKVEVRVNEPRGHHSADRCISLRRVGEKHRFGIEYLEPHEVDLLGYHGNKYVKLGAYVEEA